MPILSKVLSKIKKAFEKINTKADRFFDRLTDNLTPEAQKKVEASRPYLVGGIVTLGVVSLFTGFAAPLMPLALVGYFTAQRIASSCSEKVTAREQTAKTPEAATEKSAPAFKNFMATPDFKKATEVKNTPPTTNAKPAPDNPKP